MFRFHSHGSSLLTLCRFVQLLRQCHQHHILQTESRMWKTCMGFYGNSEKFNQKIISYNVIDDQGKRTTKNYRKSTRRVSDLLNQLEITPHKCHKQKHAFTSFSGSHQFLELTLL